MISTTGLPASFAVKLIERERESFHSAIEKNAVNKREISAFRERIGQISTVDELVADYEVYSFVMKAYDLESQIFGKAMIRKVLSSTSGEQGALIDKMTDSRFKELYRGLGFTNGGKSNKNTGDPDWVNAMVERYVSQKLINDQLESNSIVGHVLHAEAKAPRLTSWYSVLADTKLQDFFYTAFGLPDAMKGTDVDAQVSYLQKKFDLSTLGDEGVMDRLVSRYIAIAGAREAQANISSNPILQLFSSGNQSQRSIIQISLDGLSALRQGRY